MTFTTPTFIAFLVLVFSGYWSLRNRRAQNALVLIASYLFYAWWDWRFASLMLTTTVVDYSVGLGLNSAKSSRWRRVLLGASLVTNLGMLGFFKYANFFAKNLLTMAELVGLHLSQFELQVILPLGISFFTFKSLSYTIDVYRGVLKATPSLLDYATFVSFFPQLLAGPIQRAATLLPQLAKPRRFSYQNARDACRLVLWGVFKKMVVADGLVALVARYFDDPASASGSALGLATLAFAFNIYFDFAAYSDISIGVGKLLGINIPRNFAFPYFSRSVPEFWRRWHISMSFWFRDYIYTPLTWRASLQARARRMVAILLTFAVSGLWHGAAWQFVVWGLLNGLAILPSVLRAPGESRVKDVPGGEADLPGWSSFGKMILTFGFTCVCWVFFRSSDLSTSVIVLSRIATEALSLNGLAELGRDLSSRGELRTLGLVPVIIGVEWWTRRHPHPLQLDKLPRWGRWAIYTALIGATLILGARARANAFVYFQF